MAHLFTPPYPARRDFNPHKISMSDALWYFRRVTKNPLDALNGRLFKEKVVSGTFLWFPYALIHDPDLIQEAHVKNANHYELDLIRKLIFEPLTGESGILTLEGARWKSVRRAITPIFTPRHIATLGQALIKTTDQHIEALRAKNSPTLGMTEDMGDLALAILLACLFDDGVSFDRALFSARFNELFELYGAPHFFDILRLPSFIPRGGRRGRQKRVAAVYDQLWTILHDRRVSLADSKAEKSNDLLTLLLNARDEEGQPLNDQTVLDNLLTFIAAGHETTARTLSWAFYLVASAPDWKDRMLEELDRVDWADAAPEDLAKLLPITTAILQESQRLYPAVPVINRVAREDHQVGDIPIKKGTIVQSFPWILHRHQSLWRDPDSFDPSRFLGAEGKAIHRYAFIPYGMGPRACVGASFANQEMLVVFSRYWRAFDFSLTNEPAPKPEMKITLRPSTSVTLKLTPR